PGLRAGPVAPRKCSRRSEAAPPAGGRFFAEYLGIPPELEPPQGSHSSALPCRPSSIDDEVRTRHIRGRVRKQKYQRPTETVRPGHAPHRSPLTVPPDKFRIMTRFYTTEGQRIYTDAGSDPVSRKIPGETDESAFRHGIPNGLKLKLHAILLVKPLIGSHHAINGCDIDHAS